MRFKSTWVVLAAFAALAGYFFLVEQPRYEASKKAEQEEGLLFPDLDTAKITELALDGKKGSVRVRKGEDGRWFVVEPWDDRADDGRISTLLRNLEELKAAKEVAGPEADLAPFGLDEPEVVVTTKGVDLALAVGGATPVGGRRYVRVGEGGVRVAESFRLMDFLKPPEELRNKDLLEGFPWDRLSQVELNPPAGGDTVRLVKQGARWRLEAPFEAEADPDAASRITDKLRWARISRFLSGDDEARARDALGAGLTVVLRAEGEPEPVTVRLAEVDGAVWADRTGRDARFVVGKDVLDALRVDPEDLRRSRPVLLRAWKATGLSVSADGTSLAFEKTDGKWRRDGEPVAGPVAGSVEDLLRTLQDVKADEVIDAPGPLATYGLDAPAAELSVTDNDDKQQRVVLGRAGDAVYARSGDAGPVYRMPAEYLDKVEAVVRAATAPAEGEEKAEAGEGSSKP